MKKLIIVCVLVSVAALGWKQDIQLSASDKINKAFPPRAEVRIQLETMRSMVPEEDPSLKTFKTNYESKLNIRALTCSQGNLIGRFDSINDVKKLTIDRDCLNEQDDQLQDLIGIRLVGYLLSMPPLKPLANLGPPTEIHSADDVEFYTGKSASKAGVMVLRGSKNQFVSVEIPSGKKIANLPTMPEASQSSYSLSPNGRVLATVVNNQDLRFIDTETGQDLWLAGEMSQFYVWLPEVQAALVKETKSKTSKVSLIDFKMGTIKPYSSSENNQSWALNVSESPSRLLIGTYKSFAMIENSRSMEGVDSTVIKSYKIETPGASVSSLTPTLMLDGKSLLFVTGRDFMLFDLNSNNEKYWESNEIIGNNYAKIDEESLLVNGYGSSAVTGIKPYVFNIKKSTISVVENTEITQGLIYEMSNRNGFIRRSGQGIWIGDELNIGAPESLDEIITGRRLEKQLQAIENEAKMAKAREEAMRSPEYIRRMQPYMGGVNLNQLDSKTREAKIRAFLEGRPPVVEIKPPEYPPSTRSYGNASSDAASGSAYAPAQSAPYDATSNNIKRQAISAATKQMIGDIPSNAVVQAVGVYEAKDRSPSGIDVLVKKSEKPIVLMLSSYEPVRWNILKAPDANLVAIIAMGNSLPMVTGAGTTKTIIKRGQYSYKPNGPGFDAINSEAIMWTGKPISRFQGTYGGIIFTVGN